MTLVQRAGGVFSVESNPRASVRGCAFGRAPWQAELMFENLGYNFGKLCNNEFGILYKFLKNVSSKLKATPWPGVWFTLHQCSPGKV